MAKLEINRHPVIYYLQYHVLYIIISSCISAVVQKLSESDGPRVRAQPLKAVHPLWGSRASLIWTEKSSRADTQKWMSAVIAEVCLHQTSPYNFLHVAQQIYCYMDICYLLQYNTQILFTDFISFIIYGGCIVYLFFLHVFTYSFRYFLHLLGMSSLYLETRV